MSLQKKCPGDSFSVSSSVSTLSQQWHMAKPLPARPSNETCLLSGCSPCGNVSVGGACKKKKREAGIQPGIRKGDRKRRLQGFEVLLAKADAKAGDASGTAAPDNNDDNKSDDPNVAAAISAHLGREAARDKRPRGGLAPSLVALLWEHQLPAALAAGVAAAALASEKEAASSSAAMMSRFREGTAAGGEGGGGEEGPASAAAALVFAGVREVALRLLRGAGDPLSGALVFAGQPRSTAALAYGLDPSALATPVGPEGSPTIEALADGLDQVWCCVLGAREGACSAGKATLTPVAHTSKVFK